MYNINNKGPRNDPCWSMLSTSHQLELHSPITMLLSMNQKGTDPVDQSATKTISSELMDKFKMRNFIECLHKLDVKNSSFHDIRLPFCE